MASVTRCIDTEGGLTDSDHLPNHVLETAGCIEPKCDKKLYHSRQRSLPYGRIINVVLHFVRNQYNIVSTESKTVVQFYAENSLSYDRSLTLQTIQLPLRSDHRVCRRPAVSTDLRGQTDASVRPRHVALAGRRES